MKSFKYRQKTKHLRLHIMIRKRRLNVSKPALTVLVITDSGPRGYLVLSLHCMSGKQAWFLDL